MAARPSINLDGKKYEVSQSDWEDGAGPRRLSWAQRPTQAGEVGGILYADWRISGANLNSFEDLRYGEGLLSIDYTTAVDTRWPDIMVLGPEVTVIECSTHDADSDQIVRANGAAFVAGRDSGTKRALVFVSRGTRHARVEVLSEGQYPAVQLLAAQGSSFAAPSKGVVATEGPSGIEISFPLVGSAYYTVTDMFSGAGKANEPGEIADVLAVASDRIVDLGGPSKSVKHNILAGDVTMAKPNWVTIATIDAPFGVAFNNFALDGNLWILGTNYGPYVLSERSGEFFPLMPEVSLSPRNCAAMTTWFPLGVVISMQAGLRWHRQTSGESFGPEVFETNTSVHGYITALCATDEWLYACMNNPAGGSWILAGRPARRSDGTTHRIAWFVINQSERNITRDFMINVGNAVQVRVTPLIVMGHNSDVAYFQEGALPGNQVNDPRYRFEENGLAYLTEMRRQPGMLKDLEAVEFITADCGPGITIQVEASLDSQEWQPLTKLITENGFHRVDIPARLSGSRVKLRVRLKTNNPQASPRIEGGYLRLYYRMRPKIAKALQVNLLVQKSSRETSLSLRDHLLEAQAKDWVSFVGVDGETFQVRVNQVEIRDVGGDDVQEARVELLQWQ